MDDKHKEKPHESRALIATQLTFDPPPKPQLLGPKPMNRPGDTKMDAAASTPTANDNLDAQAFSSTDELLDYVQPKAKFELEDSDGKNVKEEFIFKAVADFNAVSFIEKSKTLREQVNVISELNEAFKRTSTSVYIEGKLSGQAEFDAFKELILEADRELNVATQRPKPH